ncbi:MAG: DUF3152 domain-containing protein [Pseudonocardia sp.]|nr:DUF3152 domain-containing protein [Pseudonocardia sp.]
MRRRRAGWGVPAVLVALLAASGLGACGPADGAVREDLPQPSVSAATVPPEPAAAVSAAPVPVAPVPAVAAAPAAPTPDELAGLTSRDVPQSLDGAFDVVPGRAPAPGAGPVKTIRVEVEQGVPVDPQRFAAFVMDTLNDPRSWGAGGRMTFARTDGDDATLRVLLASPDTSRRLCRPLETYGTLSCRNGARAILTLYRWTNGHEDYADDPTGYRHYLVNHEVGHALGHAHERCPGPGLPAPVMQQQTLGLKGCAQNPWPHP